ncbi:hypothetical protein HYE82_27755 [Streptomyces sp. BR123]|uniref:DUF6493 family protein n=1 Tax=Streptomyces sp. BR123 TaxID=2749828 RepID=UPI0015C45575|nr:DUF6493 family protein [Streptomyces sp. BR123]NXY98097.1 hypothetical protein [Streptomyces sp. BR123]
MVGKGVPDGLAAVACSAEELILGDGGSVTAYEELLDAVVRWAGRDRAGLAEALRPVADCWSGVHRPRAYAAQRLLAVVRAAVRPVGPEPQTGRGWLETCQHEAVRLVIGERIAEVCGWLRAGVTVPMLLAAPSRAGGAVDPRDLVMRLTEYEQAGARPGPADLGQALLRCGGGPADADVLRAAAELTLPEGPRVAAWLRQGGLPQPAWTVEQEPGPPQPPSRRRDARVGRRILVRTEVLPGRGDFPRTFWPLFRPFEPLIGCRHLLLGHRERHAAAVLPWHPEIVAARMLAEVAATADQDGESGAEFLPALAASDGPPGPAVHLALAYGLGAGPDTDREAAVAALAALAARGRLDGALLGGELARLVLLGTLRLPTVTGSLRSAAATAGADAVWPVLAAALPGLLAAAGAGTPPRPHPPLLALAADCARDCGARGAVTGVEQLAGRPGSSRSVREARRLRNILAGT